MNQDDSRPGVGPSGDLEQPQQQLVVRRKIAPRRKPQRSREEHVKVATLQGAGKTNMAIAAELRIPRRTILDMVARIDKDPALGAHRKLAEEHLRGKALEMMDRWMDDMDKDFKDAPLKEKAAAFREAREVGTPRQYNENQHPSQGPQISLQTDNPAVMASFVEALRMLNEPGKVIETVVVKQEEAK